MNFVFPDCIYDRLNCFFPSPISCWIFIHAPASIFAWARRKFCVGMQNKTTMGLPKIWV